MKKLFTSLISAAVMAVSAAAVPAQAVYIEADSDDPSITEGYTPVEREDLSFLEPLFGYNDQWSQHYDVFMGEKDILVKEYTPDIIWLMRSDSASNEDISAVLEELGISCERVADITGVSDCENCYIQFPAKGLSISDAKAITSALKEKELVTYASIRINRCSLSHWYPHGIDMKTLSFYNDKRDIVEGFFTEKGIPYHVEKGYAWTYAENGIDQYQIELEDRFRIVTEEELSVAEKWQLYDEMRSTIFTDDRYADLISPAALESYEAQIEGFDYVDGDANSDSTLTLNDAVAVLQNIALPAKYPLTAQGKFNADCDGKAGISGGDALWIQMKDAGLV